MRFSLDLFNGVKTAYFQVQFPFLEKVRSHGMSNQVSTVGDGRQHHFISPETAG
jgi:hypothetical protein